MTADYDYLVQKSYALHFVYYFLLHVFFTDMIKSREFRLLVVLILLKIELGHAFISVDKSGILMLKTVWNNR